MIEGKALLIAVWALFALAGATVRAQQAPSEVISDPPVDGAFPPALAPITVPSRGVNMGGFFYLSIGPNPHGTVVLLHGLPGYETNGDLAQSIRRAGWNVLIFSYRGTWGAAGKFSQSSAIEDTAEVVSFLRDPVNAAKYRIDRRRLVLMGHSFGGFLAAYVGSHDTNIRAVAMISAVNLGRINAGPKEREARLKRWDTQLHPVPRATARDLFQEAEQHAKSWNYVEWAPALCARPVLLVEADDQNRGDMEALAAALKQRSCTGLEEVRIATDHSFSDQRIMLQTTVVARLEKFGTR
jgi:uncharacterized protein